MKQLNKKNHDLEETDFSKAFKGKFFGILRWNQLDDLWDIIKQDCSTTTGQGWYLYSVGEAIPTEKTKGEKLTTFIGEINKLLRREHKEDYCGVVYTDSIESPCLLRYLIQII